MRFEILDADDRPIRNIAERFRPIERRSSFVGDVRWSISACGCVRWLPYRRQSACLYRNAAFYPFWSPDSRSLAFFAERPTQTLRFGYRPLVRKRWPPRQSGAAAPGVVMARSCFPPPPWARYSACPRTVENRWRSRTSSSHPKSATSFPSSCPTGVRFVFRAARRRRETRGIYLASFDGAQRRLTSADSASVITRSGHLLFQRGRDLFAQGFDVDRGTTLGEAFAVTDAYGAGHALGIGQKQGPVALAASAAGPDRLSRRWRWRQASTRLV